MITKATMKSLSAFLTESITQTINEMKSKKFSNFTKEEIEAFKFQLNDLIKEDKALKRLIDARKPLRYSGTLWEKNNMVFKSDDVEAMSVYLVTFNNPFANGAQLTKKIDKKKECHAQEPCEPDAPKNIVALAICDKFNQLHIVTEWEGEDVVMVYRPKGLFMKTKVKETFPVVWKNGVKYENVEEELDTDFYSKPGWYLKRKNYPSYYIKYEKNRNGEWLFSYPEEQNPTIVRLQECVIFDMTNLPKDIEKEIKNIKDEEEREARRKKEYEEYKKKEAEANKRREEAKRRAEEKWNSFKKEIEGYELLGFAMDPKLRDRIKKYDGEWKEYYPSYNTIYYVNHKNKVYWWGYENYTIGTGPLD